jgi:galactokinase
VLSADRVDLIQSAFRKLTGRDPQGVWAAPGRVNLIGEHTDYNDGLVLPFAIEREALTAIALRGDDQLNCWSRQQEPEAWKAYPRGVLRALKAAGLAVSGADLAVDSDVPTGGGLSSSAALECAVATALNDLAGGALERMPLALACQSAENTEVGAATGIMDQVASLYGAPGNLVYLDVRERAVESLAVDLTGLSLIVVDTGVRHSHAEGGYADRRRECADAAAQMGLSSLRDADVTQVAELALRSGHEGLLGRRAKHVFTENARVRRAVALVRAGRAADLGPVLTASHVSLRDDFEVSAPELDVAVEAALDAGALGARMTGGGFGGSALVLAKESEGGAIRKAVEAAYGRCDWRAPTVFRVTPAEGARRLR